MYYHFKIHRDKDVLWAECVEMPDCNTQSENNTIEDLRYQMEEVLNLYLNEPSVSKIIFFI